VTFTGKEIDVLHTKVKVKVPHPRHPNGPHIPCHLEFKIFINLEKSIGVEELRSNA